MLRLVKLFCLVGVLALGAATATAANRHAANRHAAKGHAAKRHAAKGRAAKGNAAKAHAANRHGAKRHRVKLGRTVLLAPRTRTSGCVLDSRPDRRCSPGAYSSRLTKSVICSSHFDIRTILRLPLSRKYTVEREYRLPAGRFTRALEIDHIVPLRLGGSDNMANLFPEEYAFASHSPGYRAKDRLDTRLRALVCGGRMPLRTAQQRIAADWQRLYLETFGHAAASKKR